MQALIDAQTSVRNENCSVISVFINDAFDLCNLVAAIFRHHEELLFHDRIVFKDMMRNFKARVLQSLLPEGQFQPCLSEVHQFQSRHFTYKSSRLQWRDVPGHSF